MNFDLDAYRDAELSEYMARARPSFTKDALCRGSIYPEIELAKAKAALRGIKTLLDISTTFFPSRGGSAKVAAAKKICERCPVQWDCFEYAYEGREQAGIWGGSSIEDRENCYRDDIEVEDAFIMLFGKKQFKKKTR